MKALLRHIHSSLSVFSNNNYEKQQRNLNFGSMFLQRPSNVLPQSFSCVFFKLCPEAVFLYPGHIFQYTSMTELGAVNVWYRLVLPLVLSCYFPHLIMYIICIQALVLSLLHSGQKGHRRLSQQKNVSFQHRGAGSPL